MAKLALDLFSETDLKILRLTQLPIVSQEDVDSALVENGLTNPSSASFTIAYNFATIHPETSFPEEVKPLLAKVGIRCRDRHMKLLSHFSKINSALNERGVSFIVIKGGAMKSYRPEWTRWMSDVDILIPGDDFREALDAVRGLGYIIGETHHRTECIGHPSFHTDGYRKGEVIQRYFSKKSDNPTVLFFVSQGSIPGRYGVYIPGKLLEECDLQNQREERRQPLLRS